MNMVLPVKELLDELTYHGIFDYFNCSTTFGAYFANAVAVHSRTLSNLIEVEKFIPPYYVEILDIDMCRIWYPYQSWINELRRRSELEKLFTEGQKKSLERQAKSVQEINLNNELLLAAMQGDTNKIQELTKQLEELHALCQTKKQ
jgi:hypothetical protein